MARRTHWLIVLAYACSGMAGLMYQVTWTRLMVLQVGHSTAAVTTVVAAFMGGLAVGAALAARLATGITRTQALLSYAALEAAVAFCALLLPVALSILQPGLASAYADGNGGLSFLVIRTSMSLALVAVPATLLGATFPIALRAVTDASGAPTVSAGRLYAVNTAGAAAGALLAGFVLLPEVGLYLTVATAATISIGAVAAALVARTVDTRDDDRAVPSERARKREPAPAVTHEQPAWTPTAQDLWIAGTIVVLTGFAGLLYEVSWTRAIASLLGPTTYAFAGTVCALITGLAIGGAAGSSRFLAGRFERRPHVALAVVLSATAIAGWWGNSLLGTEVPARLSRTFAVAPSDPGWPMVLRIAAIFILILPPAIGLGCSFPLTLRLAGPSQTSARQIGFLYALNTAAGVAGTMIFGVLLMALGLERTLGLVPVLIFAAAIAAIAFATHLRAIVRVILSAALIALAVISGASPLRWDRELLASGFYKYARGIASPLHVQALLKAATLLYYKDGQVATVSVSTFAGKTSLAVDGKVDGSTGADMLTQELAAHLPLLIHENPHDVLVIGVGTGVTVSSAALHPVDRLDVVEISPEVVEASSHFEAQNRGVLADSRTRLIVGDGRTHLALGTKPYDVIISEPSNPWMAGVAALFTRESFAAMRDRLAPGGIACQWVHTYDISEPDFRSIIATFASIFPNGTMWSIGDTDILLISSTGSLDGRLANIANAWNRPGVAADLRRVGAKQPFSVLSLWAGGPETLARIGDGAVIQTDDRMALEFSGPKAAFRKSGSDQAPLVRAIPTADDSPSVVRQSIARATAAEWRERGALFQNVRFFATAYTDYAHAVSLDASDQEALFGLAITAVPAGKETDAVRLLRELIQAKRVAVAPRIAFARLMSSMGRTDDAIAAAESAMGLPTGRELVLQELAALYSDLGDGQRLQSIVDQLKEFQPSAAKTRYYSASAMFLRGEFAKAVDEANKSVIADGSDADALNLAGAALASLGRRDEARKAFEAALLRAPEDASIYANLGLLALDAGDARRSAKLFGGALSLDPSSESALQGLQRALREQ